MLTLEEQKRARKKALKLLEYSGRSKKVLSQRLIQAGFSPEAAADAVEYASSYGYVDDLRYARSYILFRMHSKSKKKIFGELSQKGVSPDTAEAAWEEACQVSQADEEGLLKKEILKKCRPDTCLDEKAGRRLFSSMAGKGFEIGAVIRLLEEMNITVRPSWMEEK